MPRGNGGRFETKVSDGDIIHHFETRSQPVLSTGDIAEEFDLSRQQAHRRLEDLEEAGEVQRVELGERAHAWWRERDTVVLSVEDDGYSAHDLKTGVASQGESRSAALRALAEAIELVNKGGEMEAEEIYDELGLDPSDGQNGAPPF